MYFNDIAIFGTGDILCVASYGNVTHTFSVCVCIAVLPELKVTQIFRVLPTS